MRFHCIACLYIKKQKRGKKYEVHSVSKFEKYNRHRSFL